jgi:hypothetical protein
VFCFLFICIVCLYVFVWSVETDPFMEFAAVEDQEGFEQQHAWVEGNPCCIPSCPITTCISITLPLLFACINVMGPMLRCD